MTQPLNHYQRSVRIKVLIFASLLVFISSILVLILPPLNAPYPYEYAKFFHILGAVILLGNIITGAMWSIFVDVNNSTDIFRFYIKVINWADVILTAPGALLLLWNGFFMAHQSWSGFWQLKWLKVSMILFIILGVIWVCILVPIQVHFDQLSQDKSNFELIYKKLDFRRWLVKYFIFGGYSALLAISILVLMVVKPNFF